MLPLSLHQTLFQIISLNTFSNIWYWFVVGITWAIASYWIMGVPFDMVLRARRQEIAAEQDLDQWVRISARRIQHLTTVGGVALMGLVSFALSANAMIAFYYGSEIAKGVFFLAFPMAIVGIFNIRLAQRFVADQPQGVALAHTLLRWRFFVQILGMVSVFISAMYGMYFNLSLPVRY